MAENSREAFANAAQEGFTSECDVWASSDGVAIVMHDQTLDRTTISTGKVSGKTAAELSRIALRTSDGTCGTIPTLGDVADFVSHVEIKPGDAQELVQRVMQLMLGRAWILQSFDERNLLHARRINPMQEVVYLVEEAEMLDVAIDHRWPVNIDAALFQDGIIGKLQDAGISVGAWTVNDQETLNRVLAYQPDTIITDVPVLVRKWLGTAT